MRQTVQIEDMQQLGGPPTKIMKAGATAQATNISNVAAANAERIKVIYMFVWQTCAYLF